MTKLGMKRAGKQKPLKPISDEKRESLKEEKKLRQEIYEKQGGLCIKCGKRLGFGWAKHEKVFRSHGGDPLDKDNTEGLCLVCHGLKHHERLIMEE